MDPDVAKMMADLGLHRRDAVSAPEDDRASRSDPRMQAAVLSKERLRRTQLAKAANQTVDEKAAKLAAWNTESTFEKDDVTSRLVDRYSGQGHRAELSRRVGSAGRQDGRLEAATARYGEERANYLREHNRMPSSDGFASLLPAGQRIPSGGSHRGVHSPHKGAGSRRSGPMPVSHPSNPNRASVSRLMGTVRITSDGTKTVPTPGGERAMTTPALSTAAAAKIRAAAQLRNTSSIAASSAATQSAPTAMMSSVHAPRAASTGTSEAVQAKPAPQVAPGAAPTSSGLEGSSSTSSNVVHPVKHTAGEQQMYHYQALKWAANPGAECDAYYKKYPDRRQYLAPAIKRLIDEAFYLAKKGDQAAVKAYLDGREDRAWIVECAVKAKHQVEEEINEEIKAYCAKHLRQRTFYEKAKSMFAPKPENATPKPVTKQIRRVRSSSSSSASSGSATSETSVETAISVPDTIQNAVGTLVVTFYDMAKHMLGNYERPLNFPASVKLDVTAQARGFDPRSLIQSMEALARNMQEEARTNAAAVQGAKLARDGLWEESDEEL